MGVNVKMGVDLGEFDSKIKEGQMILRGLNAEMKATESEFKKTGNSTEMLEKKTKTLNSQLQIQKGIADQAKKALKEMDKEGVQPNDKDYQRLYTTLMNAQAGMYEAEAALKALGQGAEQAAGKADTLTKSVNGISKKISLEQVMKGVNAISTGLENAASKAKALGEQIWNAVMDRAKWADDTATMAQMYGIDVEKFQKMQKLVTNGMDTSVEAMLKSQDKLKKGIGDGNKAVIEAFDQLGIRFKTYQKTATGQQLMPRDSVELFWEAGQAIMNLGNEYDKESKAQALFGRSWKELSDLFKNYKTVEDYNKALDKQNVVSEESVNQLVELNDKVGELKGNFDTLQSEVLGGLAPALTGASDALNGLLTSLLEYLKTDDGQKLLNDLGTAVTGLFEDLSKIDPQKVIDGFTGVFNTVIGSFQWMVDNKETLEGLLAGILAVWAATKITGSALEVVNMINGIKGLTAASGAAAGASWGGAFASAVAKAAPWLLFMYELLKPNENTHDKTGNTGLLDENGNLTKEAEKYGFKKDENGELYQDRREIVSKAIQEAWDLYRTNKFTAESLTKLQREVNDNDLYNKATQLIYETLRQPGGMQLEDLDLTEILKGLEPPKVEVDPEAPKDASQQLSEEIGTVPVPVVYVPTNGESVLKVRTPSGIGFHANGLPFVPYDNYPALLHKGERVIPARAVNNRSYSSNLYVERMIMNNGTDAEGLAERMAAAQRREMSSLGS